MTYDVDEMVITKETTVVKSYPPVKDIESDQSQTEREGTGPSYNFKKDWYENPTLGRGLGVLFVLVLLAIIVSSVHTYRNKD
jgi:hypothetical protein